LENKKLTNIKDGDDNQDALSKKQILELLLLKVNLTDLNKMFKFENGFIKGQAYIDMGNRYFYDLRNLFSDSHSVNLRYLKSFTYRKLDIDNKIATATFDASRVVLTGNLNMNNNKIINLAGGVDDGDAMNKKQINEYVGQQTILLKDTLPGKVTNNKAVIYSSSGSVHADSLYLKDQYEQEVRFIVEDQNNMTMHLYLPNLLDLMGKIRDQNLI